MFVKDGQSAFNSDFQFNLSLFKRKLSDCVKFEHITSDNLTGIATFRLFDKTRTDFAEDCLYICSENNLPAFQECLSKSKKMVNAIFVVSDDMPCDVIDCDRDNFDYLVVSGISVSELLNQVIIDVDFWKIANGHINQMLASDADLQEIIEQLADYVQIPLLCLDVNHNILAVSTHHAPATNALWRAVSENDRQTIDEILDHMPPIDDFEEVRPRSAIGLIAQKVDIVKTTAICGQIFDYSHLVAYVWAFPNNQSLDLPSDQLMFYWLCDKIANRLHKSSLLPLGRGDKQEVFALNLLDGIFTSSSGCVAAAKKADVPFDAGSAMQMVLVVPDAVTVQDRNRILNMEEKLEKLIPDSIAAIYNNAIVVLFAADDSGLLSAEIERGLDEFGSVYRSFIIEGNLYNDIMRSNQIYNQLRSTLMFIDVGTEPAYGIYHYYDYAVLQCNLTISKQQPIESIVHPFVRKLRNYDLAHDTDYLDTLKAYLNCHASITEAASELNMHRNTLIYRLDKIEKLLQVEFKDWNLRRLMLYSIDMMHFNKMLQDNDFSGEF